MSHYETYFSRSQTGRGISDIGTIYRSNYHLQRGKGLSDVFAGLYKFISPFILRGTKALGKEALRTGSEVLSNIGTHPIKNLLSEQRDKSLKNLTAKAGVGLKRMGAEIASGSGFRTKKAKIGVIHTLKSVPIRRARKSICKSKTKKKTKKPKPVVKRHKPVKRLKKPTRKVTKPKKRGQSAKKSDFLQRFLGNKF